MAELWQKMIHEIARPYARVKRIREAQDAAYFAVAQIQSSLNQFRQHYVRIVELDWITTSGDCYAASIDPFADEIGGSGRALHRCMSEFLAESRELIDRNLTRITAVGDSLRKLELLNAPLALASGQHNWLLHEILALLLPHKVCGFDKVRLGNDRDGGYVMLDDFVGTCAALSLGIGDDVSWDLAVANRILPVLQFDHAVRRPPIAHPRFAFFQEKVVPSEPALETECTIATILARYAAADEKDFILKMDIEGDEWDILRVIDPDTLGRFRQIICEFHELHRLRYPAERLRALQVFRKLSRSHCVVHVHGNNHRPIEVVGDISIPDVLEITWVRRKDYKLLPARTVFPTELDRPNNPYLPDHRLGTFEFHAARWLS